MEGTQSYRGRKRQKDHETLGVKSTDRALDLNRLCELGWVVLSQPKMTVTGWAIQDGLLTVLEKQIPSIYNPLNTEIL